MSPEPTQLVTHAKTQASTPCVGLTGGEGGAVHLVLVALQLSVRRELTVTEPAALPVIIAAAINQL